LAEDLYLCLSKRRAHVAYRDGSERHGLLCIERAYRFFCPEAIETAFTNYAILAASVVADRFEHEQRHLTLPRSSGDR
jgi:hypothetical protein